MLKTNMGPKAGKTLRHLLWIAALALLVGLLLPATLGAAPPEQGGTERCATCHDTETTAWETSPHAGEGVTCETCHGAYVEDHPKKGVMQLDVDSSVCTDCHKDTSSQWQASPHATAGVQCIGCHLSHSQDFRLTDEALCSACHRDRLDDQAHASHLRADIACTECHVSGKDVSGTTNGTVAAPNHGFGFTSEVCVECHIQTFHEESKGTRVALAASTEIESAANATQEMATKLESAQQGNRLLRTMTIVNLGLGLGIGGMLGVIGVMVVGSIGRGKEKK